MNERASRLVPYLAFQAAVERAREPVFGTVKNIVIGLLLLMVTASLVWLPSAVWSSGLVERSSFAQMTVNIFSMLLSVGGIFALMFWSAGDDRDKMILSCPRCHQPLFKRADQVLTTQECPFCRKKILTAPDADLISFADEPS